MFISSDCSDDFPVHTLALHLATVFASTNSLSLLFVSLTSNNPLHAATRVFFQFSFFMYCATQVSLSISSRIQQMS